MDKNLKCIMCGCFVPIAVVGTLYCFTEKYCNDCKEKIEEQKHIIENTIPTNAKQIYVSSLSGTNVVIDTSTNYFDSQNFYKNLKL